MSDNIPFEIQVEIIKRLPVKSVLQFRSVSKQWRSLIDSSEFVGSYRVPQTHSQRLLVWYRDLADLEQKYVSFVDDDDDDDDDDDVNDDDDEDQGDDDDDDDEEDEDEDEDSDEDDDDQAFTPQEFAPSLPLLYKNLDDLEMRSSSQGLFCLSGTYESRGHRPYCFVAVLWNPCIRKSVCIRIPCVSGWCDTAVGFGVCPITNDPTIVKITNVSRHYGREVTSPIVEVFKLSRGSWRVPSTIPPKKSITVTWSHVAIDSCIFWVAYVDDPQKKQLVISFDMTTEEFRVIDLPDSLAQLVVGWPLSILKLRDSLALLDYITYRNLETETEFKNCDVWIMDHAVPHSFTKLYTIDTDTPYEAMRVLGFTSSGEPIMEIQEEEDDDEPAALVVYEPSTQHIKDIGIEAQYLSSYASSYMESLLLLDQPAKPPIKFTYQRKGKRVISQGGA